MAHTGRTADPDSSAADIARAARPHFLALMLLGLTVFDRPRAIAASSVVGALAEAGVASQAARSALTRMCDRGVVERYRSGRESFYALTAHGTAVLKDGQDTVLRSPAREWDGTWTLVSFSLPEERRDLRHQLRSRLVWRGFGPLQNGMWIAAGRVDVEQLQLDLHLSSAIRAFTAISTAPTDNAELIDDAFDVRALAERYHTFLARWSGRDNAADLPASPLGRQLLLRSEWAQITRTDPHLPLRHLPGDWPALRAFHRYTELDHELTAPSRRIRRRLVQTAPVGALVRGAATARAEEGADPTPLEIQ